MVLWQPEVVEAFVVERGSSGVGDWEAEKVETHGERKKKCRLSNPNSQDLASFYTYPFFSDSDEMDRHKYP